MALTKTQAELLRLAATHGGSYSIEVGGGRGRKGGRISFGSRERSALNGLVKLGRATITHRQSSQECVGNGNFVYSTIIAFRVSEVK